jgi:hypothetical protein
MQESLMSSLNSEGVAEFERLVTELADFVEDMSEYEKKFMYDQIERIDTYGDKLLVTETQLEFIRKLYRRIL